MKKESSQSSSSNVVQLGNPSTRPPKGHRQRGAGTVTTGKGDIVVSGVIMKEWQRTPKKLVEEWCQKQKRPRPCYNQAPAPEKSGGGQKSGGGTGATRCWLTLPDPKKPEKSLKFLTEQGFATLLEAEHSSALLALFHLNPEIPQDRILPEPYRTMWLHLVGREDTSSGSGVQDQEEEAAGKKGKKKAAWKIAEEEKEREKEALTEEVAETTTKTRAPVPVVQVSSLSTGAKSSASSSTTSSSSSPSASSSLLQSKVVVDPTAVVPLTSSLKFVSVQEKEQFERKRAEEQAKRQQMKQVSRMTNRDTPCYMEEKYRVLVEKLIREAASTTAESEDETEESSGFDDDDDAAVQFNQQVLQHVVKVGFTPLHAQRALSRWRKMQQADDAPDLGQAVAACLDWLCLNLPEDELPAHLTVKGKHLEVFKKDSNKTMMTQGNDKADSNSKSRNQEEDSGSNRSHASAVELSAPELHLQSAGFLADEVCCALKMNGGDRQAALQTLYEVSARSACSLTSLTTVLQSDAAGLRSLGENSSPANKGERSDLQGMLEEEKEVLLSIYDQEFSVEVDKVSGWSVWRVALTVNPAPGLFAPISRLHNIDMSPEESSFQVSVEMHLPPPASCRYPLSPPVVLLRSNSDTSFFSLHSVRRAVNQALARFVSSGELQGAPVMYACCMWVQDMSEEEGGLGAVLVSLLADLQQEQRSQDNQKQQSPADFQRVFDSSEDDIASNKSQKEHEGNWERCKKIDHVKESHAVSTHRPTRLSKRETDELSKSLFDVWTQNTNQSKKTSTAYIQMQKNRSRLPAAQFKATLLESIANNQIVLVSGETGCGKTTQVPQFILDDFVSQEKGGEVKLICTQPRRLAAIGVADRVAAEQCSPLGETVGYQVRMDSRKSKSTRLVFCTTGILLRQLHSDPDLAEVTHLLLDEVHERDVDTDFLLALLKPLLQRRKSLKLILMSATMDTSLFVRYFESICGQCPVLHIPGFVHPVKEYYLDELDTIFSQKGNFLNNDNTDDREVEDEGEEEDRALKSSSDLVLPPKELKRQAVNYEEKYSGHRFYSLIAKTVMYADKMGTELHDDGAILVFMSGNGEINRAITAIEQLAGREGRLQSFWVLPLHGSLSAQDQQKVFKRPSRGMRKIVVCTNVAETSITIDDCVYVIDSGKMKEMEYEAENRMSALVEKYVSSANARQRRGRAGRVRPGHCFRLFTRNKFESLKDHQLPEIHRVPLERLCLMVRFLNLGKPKPFLMQVIEPPSEMAVTAALKHLRQLGAMDEKNMLTPLGRHLAGMPVDAQIGKMLIFGAILRCPDQILSIAAGLSARSPFMRDAIADQTKLRLSGRYMSDHIALLKAVEGWRVLQKESERREYCREMGLHSEGMKQLWELRSQLHLALDEAGFSSSAGSSSSSRLRSKAGGAVEGVHTEEEHSQRDINVIKAVLCAALYPNVARVHLPTKQYEELSGGAFEKNVPAHEIKFFVQGNENRESALDNSKELVDSHARADSSLTEDSSIKESSHRVFLHPSSALFAQGSLAYEIPWLVFFEKVRTSKVFLHDATMVTPYSLLLFGGQLEILHEKGKLLMDNWMYFTAPARVGILVRELRRALDNLLLDKISRPRMDLGSSPIIEAIILLLRTNGI